MIKPNNVRLPRIEDKPAKAVADILKTDFTDTGATREGLGKAVVAANAYLSENYGASPLDIPTQEQTYLPKGTVLSLAV